MPAETPEEARARREARERRLVNPETTMHVYEVDVGVQYWIAAPTLYAACKVFWETVDMEGSAEDVDSNGSLSIERLDPKQWPQEYDDGDDPAASFTDLVARTTEPSLLSCSEY